MTKTPRRLQLTNRNMRKLQALGLEGALRRSGWDGPVPADEEYGWFLVAMCHGWVVWPSLPEAT